jgi:trans-aconitate methyltransferase
LPTDQNSLGAPAKQRAASWAQELIGQQNPPQGPFVCWHLRKKFSVMAALFQKYLSPESRIADIGCGDGDALVIASLCGFSSELWGIDMDSASLQRARERLPAAKLHQGDMHDPYVLPGEYFDVVHEFGAAFLSKGWNILARAYMGLLKDGGILLWELPQRWSLAHIAYLLTVAPKLTEDEPKLKRLLRSVLPSKYRFESDQSVMNALQTSGCGYEILEKVSVGSFYCPKLLHFLLDWAWRYFGDGMFDTLDRITRSVWPKDVGYYLVIRKRMRSESFPRLP